MRIIKWYKRLIYLKQKGWYRNMAGGLTSPSRIAVIPRKGLFLMSDDEWEEIAGRR